MAVVIIDPPRNRSPYVGEDTAEYGVLDLTDTAMSRHHDEVTAPAPVTTAYSGFLAGRDELLDPVLTDRLQRSIAGWATGFGDEQAVIG